MKTFNYHSAKDVKEASKLASSSSAFLAGGMTTLPSMKLGLASYKDIIDIKTIAVNKTNYVFVIYKKDDKYIIDDITNLDNKYTVQYKK